MASKFYVDPDHALDLSEIPSTMISDMVGKMANARLIRFNRLLYHAADQILIVQQEIFGSNVEGNVLLRLDDCGDGCLGCPHPRWSIIRVRQNHKINSPRYGEKYLTQPVISQPGKVRKVRSEPRLRVAVDDALRLIAARSRLVEPLSRLRRHLSNNEIPETQLDLLELK